MYESRKQIGADTVSFSQMKHVQAFVFTVFVCSIWVRSMNILAPTSFNGSLNSCSGRSAAWVYSGHKQMAAEGYPHLYRCSGEGIITLHSSILDKL